MTVKTSKLIKVSDKKFLKLPRTRQPTSSEVYYFNDEVTAREFVSGLGQSQNISTEKVGHQWLVMVEGFWPKKGSK